MIYIISTVITIGKYLTYRLSPQLGWKLDVITLEERESVLRSHFQNKVSQEKTILQVWGITKGTSVKYKAAREKYRLILREAGELATNNK